MRPGLARSVLEGGFLLGLGGRFGDLLAEGHDTPHGAADNGTKDHLAGQGRGGAEEERGPTHADAPGLRFEQPVSEISFIPYSKVKACHVVRQLSVGALDG